MDWRLGPLLDLLLDATSGLLIGQHMALARSSFDFGRLGFLLMPWPTVVVVLGVSLGHSHHGLGCFLSYCGSSSCNGSDGSLRWWLVEVVYVLIPLIVHIYVRGTFYSSWF